MGTDIREGKAGQASDLWDEIIADLELALRVAKQANLLADTDAHNLLRMVNGQVKAQASFEPKLKERFATVTEYFSNSRGAKQSGVVDPQD